MPDTPGSEKNADRSEEPDAPLGAPRLTALAPRLSARARLLRRKLRASGASLRERLEPLDEEYVEARARDVDDADLATVVEEADAIEDRFRSHGPLRRLLEDGRLLLGLVRDVKAGRYKSVPAWTLSAAAFALLYVLNPFDVIPDAVPLVGVLDDAAVVSACLKLLEQDLHDYRRWRQANAQASRAAGATEKDEISG
ncbi:MAG: YkvA family protein [Salinibacter sp.]